MVAALKRPDFMTVEAFVLWDAPTGQLWQLVDGIPQAMAPPSPTHGLIQAEAGALIRNHLIANGSSCNVVVTPGVIPRVLSDTNMRIPDLAVTCAPGLPQDDSLREPLLFHRLQRSDRGFLPNHMAARGDAGAFLVDNIRRIDEISRVARRSPYRGRCARRRSYAWASKVLGNSSTK